MGTGDFERVTTNEQKLTEKVEQLHLTLEYCREKYQKYNNINRSEMAVNAKRAHILPQGGIDGDTEYDDEYVECHVMSLLKIHQVHPARTK